MTRRRSRRAVLRKTPAVVAGAGLAGCQTADLDDETTPTGADTATQRTDAPDDLYRPVFHYAPPSGWMNDPNGLAYHDGVYHLYYQYNPTGLEWGHIHWGHATSTDLVTWTDHDPVLAPEDGRYPFSGGAVVVADDTAGFGPDSLVLTFTGHHTDSGVEDQRLAHSTNGGATAERYADNPVIGSDDPDFRDPNVVRYGEEWRLVVSRVAGTDDRPAGVEIYSSADLTDWTYESTYELRGRHDAGAWECPDLFRLPVAGAGDDYRWVLMVSADGGRVDYHVGEFDGTTFELAERVVADHGFDFYAAMSWASDPDAGRRLVGWLNNWAYAESIPATGWRGAQSVPRRLELVAADDGVGVRQHPVESVADARGERLASLDGATVSPDADPLAGTGAAGRALDVEARLVPGDADAVGIAVRTAETERTLVEYHPEMETLLLDRAESGAFFHERHPQAATTVPLEPREDGTVDLRVLVDRSSVEVFANDGRRAASALVFPDWHSTGARLTASGGTAEVASLDVWEVDPE